jgi:hypothetical protein
MNIELRRVDRAGWIVIALVPLIIGIQTWATYRFLTEPYTGGNDFYSRWAGAKALLVEGRDPYSPEVTSEIQMVKGIDPDLEGKGSFAYPLPVILLFWPLVYLSYPLALAIWMTLLIWMVIVLIIILLSLFGWRPKPIPLAGVLLSTLLLYPVSRSVSLGQFTIHVTLFLGASLLLLRKDRDGWAGVFLAAASVKGQMLILTAPWLVIWSVAQRRWRFLGGLLLTGAIMFLTALVIFPGWPASFVADLQRYSSVAGGKSPLVVLGDQLAPGAGQLIRIVLTIALLFLTIRFCWLGLTGTGKTFYRATYWTIIAGLLIFFQTGTTNQVLLLVPLIDWLSALFRRKRGPAMVSIVLLLLVFMPWIIFIETVQGNAESAVMFWPLPVLALLVLAGLSRSEIVPASRPDGRFE